MQKQPSYSNNTPRDTPYQFIKKEIPRAPSAITRPVEPGLFKQPQASSNCNSNKSRSSKNSTGFDESNMRISHFHTNTAPVQLDEMFLLKDQDTGNVYDIRNTDKIQVNKDYLAKLKKRHKSAWQGWWQQKRENNSQLISHTKGNNLREVQKLLDISSRDLRPEINIRDDNGTNLKQQGNTPLHYSCQNTNYDMTLMLLKNEADCEASNQYGQTALIIAAIKGCDAIVSLLLTIGSDLNHQDNEMNTALHHACILQHYRVAEILLARPSLQINLRNLENKSSLDLANHGIKLLFERHLKMKRDSFNQCQRVQIYEDTKDQQINSPSGKYYFNQQSRYQSPQKEQFSSSNRTTVYGQQYDDKEIMGPQNIRIILQIGKGSFGDVYLVEKRIPNKAGQGPKYAMKVLPKSKFIGHNLIRYALTERNILSFLNHPFIVKLRFAFQTNTHLCLLMDFCPGGDLSKIIQSHKRIPEQFARLYTAEILTALEHLHKNDIIYRDLKPENIVIDGSGHAMLTDFGLSKEGVRDNYGAKSFCGSMAYLAPEMLKRMGHGRAVDWYHLGILLYEMVTGKPPYFSPNRDEMLNNIEQNKISFPENLTKECRSLIIALIEKNPIQRLGASSRDADEIKEHPFFKQIVWDDLMKRKYKAPAPEINQDILNQKFDIPFDFILSADKSSSINYINGWSFINNSS
ncbi:hypothetical protein pb186bvf_018823 [Paramecium bursaria]